MLEEFAACIWRLNRARRVETAFLRKLTENAPDRDMALAMAFLEKTAEMNRLQRYITSIERAYNRAMTNLHNIVKARQQAEAKAAAIDPWQENPGGNSADNDSNLPESLPAAARQMPLSQLVLPVPLRTASAVLLKSNIFQRSRTRGASRVYGPAMLLCHRQLVTRVGRHSQGKKQRGSQRGSPQEIR